MGVCKTNKRETNNTKTKKQVKLLVVAEINLVTVSKPHRATLLRIFS